jgi:hypothetical protein
MAVQFAGWLQGFYWFAALPIHDGGYLFLEVHEGDSFVCSHEGATSSVAFAYVCSIASKRDSV